jgi:DNA-binding transcriptional regulator YiaG
MTDRRVTDREMRANFCKMRRALGLPQPWFAKQTGINSTLISAWETGRRKLSPDQITNLFDALNIAVIERANEKALPPASVSQNSTLQGSAVAALRNRWGISQAEAARESGIADATISLAENGYVELTEAEWQSIYDALYGLVNKKRALLKLPPLEKAVPLSTLKGQDTKETIKADPKFQLAVAHRAGRTLFEENKNLREKVRLLEQIHEQDRKTIDGNDEKIALWHARIEQLEEFLEANGITVPGFDEIAPQAEKSHLTTQGMAKLNREKE